MACRACRAGQVVVAVDVAIGTLPRRRRVRPGQRESRAAVIEFAIRPKHAVVAGLTRSREMRSDVVHRRGCRVVVIHVASHAGGARQVVVVINVAIRALPRRHRVRSDQREAGRGVVECRV
jgi:hypothetical protein